MGIGVGEDVLDESRVNRDLTSEELDIGGVDVDLNKNVEVTWE